MISFKPKRPWKRFAQIERVELNNGDVKFAISYENAKRITSERVHRWVYKLPEPQEFESLTEAEGVLNNWWAEWWPKQVKSRRPA